MFLQCFTYVVEMNRGDYVQHMFYVYLSLKKRTKNILQTCKFYHNVFFHVCNMSFVCFLYDKHT